MTLTEPDWNSENASELRSFLKTATGKQLVAILEWRRPAFFSSTAHPHKSFANSREIYGYEQAIRSLLGLIEADEQPLSAASNAPEYPDLDDDSLWTAQTPDPEQS
jgi:hypothetical protein